MARRLTDTYFVTYKLQKVALYDPEVIYRMIIIIPDDVVNIKDHIYRYIYENNYIHRCDSLEKANRYITILNIRPL